MDQVDVTAVIVTRGNVSLDPILSSLPPDWPVVVWDNSVRQDLSVYGRYAALEEISTPLAYVQDDDVIVSDPEEIVRTWKVSSWARQDYLVANMPQEFRYDWYTDHCLVGFGAAFHRDAPKRAFERFIEFHGGPKHELLSRTQEGILFNRDCDLIFTALTQRVLVDVPKQNLPWAEDADRLYRQRDHQEKRQMMLELALQVRDA